MAIDDSFYTDQGLDFMPRIKYLLNPPTEEDQKDDGGDVENLIVNAGIPTKNIIGGGGISSVSPATTLLEDFSRATTNRQNKLTNPDGLASMLYNFGLPQQRSVDQMKRDATAFNMAKLAGDTRQMPIFQNMNPDERIAAIKEYMADETSVGNYPAEDPRDVRFQFGIPTLTNILNRILPSSYYDKMTVPEQIYTQTKMGYTGPTIFGENTTGGNKDIFGRNVVSGFGNYIEKQKKDIEKLNKYFDSELFDKRYGEETVLEFDENLGQYVFKGPGAKDATRRNRLNLLRYNYDQKGIKEFEQIKEDTGYNEVAEANINRIKQKERARRETLDDRGFTTSGGIKTSRAGSENTATGGYGGGADMGGGAGSTTNEQGYTSGGAFSGLKEGGLARILGL